MSKSKAHMADLERLQAGVTALTTSPSWREFLRVQAIFHQYSYRNALLISRQCPQASCVAGYRAWRTIGRYVRTGEQAIWILAPSRSRIDVEHRSSSEPPIRYVAVPVFDISQTEGRELPNICRPLVGGEHSGLFTRFVEVGRRLEFAVELCELSNGVNGECHFAGRTIRIESRNGWSQRVKSLAHELAHAILHIDASDRSLAELEAESAAYLICQRCGIDSSGYSFGYLATWARDGSRAVEAIHQSCERIQRAVQRVFDLAVAIPTVNEHQAVA